MNRAGSQFSLHITTFFLLITCNFLFCEPFCSSLIRVLLLSEHGSPTSSECGELIVVKLGSTLYPVTVMKYLAMNKTADQFIGNPSLPASQGDRGYWTYCTDEERTSLMKTSVRSAGTGSSSSVDTNKSLHARINSRFLSENGWLDLASCPDLVKHHLNDRRSQISSGKAFIFSGENLAVAQSWT